MHGKHPEATIDRSNGCIWQQSETTRAGAGLTPIWSALLPTSSLEDVTDIFLFFGALGLQCFAISLYLQRVLRNRCLLLCKALPLCMSSWML